MLFDAEQLVILRDAIRSAGGTGLDLAAVRGDREIGNGHVFRLAAAMTHDRREFIPLRHFNGFERFGERADLIHLHQDAIRTTFGDAPFEACRVGHEEVVTDELNLAAKLGGELLPTGPIVFAEAIFDADDRVLVTQPDPKIDHFIAGNHLLRIALKEAIAFLLVLVFRFFVKLGSGRVEGEADLFAELVTGRLDRRRKDG